MRLFIFLLKGARISPTVMSAIRPENITLKQNSNEMNAIPKTRQIRKVQY